MRASGPSRSKPRMRTLGCDNYQLKYLCPSLTVALCWLQQQKCGASVITTITLRYNPLKMSNRCVFVKLKRVFCAQGAGCLSGLSSGRQSKLQSDEASVGSLITRTLKLDPRWTFLWCDTNQSAGFVPSGLICLCQLAFSFCSTRAITTPRSAPRLSRGGSSRAAVSR